MCPRRRDVLRAGGVAALLSGGLAGCIEDITEPSGSSQPAYADWLFDTSALLEATFRGFYAVDVAAYRKQQAALPAPANEAVQRAADQYEGVALEDFDRVTGVGALSPRDGDRGDRFLLTSVGTGSFDADAAGSAIEANSEVSAAGSYEGYDLYAQRDRYRPSFTAAAAVADEAVVLAMAEAGGEYRRGPSGRTPPSPSGTPAGGLSATAAAKQHVDAAAAGTDGLLSASSRLGRLAASLDGPVVGGLTLDAPTLRERFGLARAESDTPRPEQDGRDGEDNGGSDGGGASTPTPDDRGTSPVQRHLRRVTMGLTAFGGSADASGASDGEVDLRLLYESASAANEGASAVRDLRDALRKQVDAFTVPEVTVEANGDLVAVTITGDPSAFYEELGIDERNEPRPRAPQVAFSFERREDGRVTVTHDGGDEVGDSGTLVLLYESDGERVERQWAPDDGSVTAGDSVTTERPVSDSLRVVWNSEEGGASATLGLYRPPEERTAQDPPEATFDFELRSDGSVTVTHGGGDVVERGLVVRYDETDGNTTEKWAEADDAIEPGDTYTLGGTLAEDGSVQVLWPGDDRPVVLAEFRAGSTPTPTPAERETRTATGAETATQTATPAGTREGTATERGD